MKTRFILILTAFLLCVRANSQAMAERPAYDSLLAKKLGADDYGMKTYVMAFLKSGKVKLTDSTERLRLQMAHLKNIQRMAAEDKLVVAGPFLDNQPIRGIYIFNVATVEEAQKLTETDPAIKAGTLEMELHPWYGSAALVEALHIHYSLEKKKITD
jgi:uncharacterized protein YciI